MRRWLRLGLVSTLAALPVTCALNQPGTDLSGGGLQQSPGARVNPEDPLLTEGH